MPINYPVSKDDSVSLPNPGSSDKQNSPDHAGLHTAENAAIIALETKVGTGASAPASGTLLMGTGPGTSAWSQLTSAQLAAALSDETGSGSAVFANTPVLITPKVDTINENTVGNGVTVAGVNLKSGVVTATSLIGTLATNNAVASANIAANAVTTDKVTASGCSLTKAGAQSIPNSTNTVLTWDTEGYDTAAYHDTTTNTSRITVPTAGKYLFTASIGYVANATGDRGGWFMKNGTTSDRRGLGLNRAAGTFDHGIQFMLAISLAANDYMEVVTLQNSGGALNTQGDSVGGYTTFSVTRLGS